MGQLPHDLILTKLNGLQKFITQSAKYHFNLKYES